MITHEKVAFNPEILGGIRGELKDVEWGDFVPLFSLDKGYKPFKGEIRRNECRFTQCPR